MGGWQDYIDDQMMAGGCMYASINAFDGSLWACSPGFTVLPEECTKLATILQGSDLSPIATTGFTIAGQNYTFTRGEVDDDEGAPSYVQGRCKDGDLTSQGVIVFATSQAVVIGVHDPKYAGNVSFNGLNTTLGKMVDFMVESGF